MSADPQAVQVLFARAIEIADLAAREKLLAVECAGKPELYERVVRLLSALDGSKGFLEQPTKAPTETGMLTASMHQAGQVIAERYKLLEAIGEGGMGTVWVAEQTQPIRRKVALKLVKPGMDTKQVLARFDAERQALALMDHPNIAKVFDGGVTDQGRPFFAMEYVKGMPLTQYCDQMRLPVEDRLKLFVPICQAVQHAHQKGIIHRDLKPSNVLICLYDGKPVPKVIDFGLAKAMHQPLTEHTMHTGHGLMIGTPLYMSPEQAEHNNLDVDTRTDVYSLGVMLYELLTGSTPLEKAQFKDAAFGEILRLIKEVEPPKPSTRVSTSAQLPNIAAQRNLDPDKLGRSIRGDLDWIVMKAIEKERDRRYETANGLARDIERFLNLEAVEACPPSTGYRLRRLARKHRAAIASTAAFAAIVLLGAGLSMWQAFRATKAESLASQRLVDVQFEQRKTHAALQTSQQNEQRALQSESEAVAARQAEEQAKLAEAVQRQHAEQQRDEAKRLQLEATAKSNELLDLTEHQRRVIYTSEMNQVRIEAQRGNLARMREILLDQLPIDGKEDLRGFEWNYWYRYLNQAQVLNRFEKATVDTRGSAVVTVLPGGRQVAWTQGDFTEIVDLVDATSRRLPFPQRLYVDRTRYSDTGRAVFGACYSHTFPLSNRKPPGVDQGSRTSCSVYDPTGVVHTLEYPTDAFVHVSAINISLDGNQVVVVGYDSTHSQDSPASRVCVWNVDSRQLILSRTYPLELNRVSFSPDGKKLAAHLCHGTNRQSDMPRTVVVILDAVTGEQFASLDHDDDIDSVFWLPDSQRLLLGTLGFSGANRKQLYAWNTQREDGRLVLLTRETLPDYVVGVVSPDGSTLATTSHTTTSIRLFDTSRGDLLETIYTDGRGLVSLAYSSDGRQLTAATNTGEILRWELGKNHDLFGLRTKPLPPLAQNGYALSPDQSLLGIVLADGTVLTRTRVGHETILGKGAPSSFNCLRISPDNQFLAYCKVGGPQSDTFPGGRALVEMYDVRAGRKIWAISCSRPINPANLGSESVSAMEFNRDNDRIAIAGPLLTVLETRTGKGTAFDLRTDESTGAQVTLHRHSMTGMVNALYVDSQPGAVFKAITAKLSPNGKYIAEANGFVRISTIEPKEEIRIVDMTRHGLRFASGDWSPDSRYYAYGSNYVENFGIWVLDVTTGENRQLANIEATNPHWSPDGRFITADERNTNQIVILDLEPLRLEQGFLGLPASLQEQEAENRP